ncbi:UDP-N-acetyl-D-mannosamine dehydrogenase [Rothia sp. CCM 9418]|uniref:UDP-N-acetyl-D-mannosamine dehydrogenase n=1 Tax=Rothia sp. CCM 9418 TaxID=3402661 RepID=UPI003AE73B39
MSNRSVTFVGLGYIGLPTAVIMANHGLDVHGFDINEQAVDAINSGELTIVEPGLKQKLRHALDSGCFRASTEPRHSDTFVIAVPTPCTETKEGDLSYIFSAGEKIAPLLRGGELIILESTSPPQTTQKLAQYILSLRPDLCADGAPNPQGLPVIYFAHCPERILPGRALEELVTNDRIIGGQSPRAVEKACELYRTFCTGELLETDDVTAELAKLTENSFRDVNIAFANELSLIAETLGVDVWKLIELANHHPRVNILQPGPGVGGHCIAVDPWFIVSSDPKNSPLIRTAREVNDRKPQWVIEQVHAAVACVDSARIAVLGLSFKADIDDLRESAALKIAQQLAHELPGVSLAVVEPHISELPSVLRDYPQVHLASLEDALEEANIVLLLVDHQVFSSVPACALAGKEVIDTKGFWR